MRPHRRENTDKTRTIERRASLAHETTPPQLRIAKGFIWSHLSDSNRRPVHYEYIWWVFVTSPELT